MGIVLQKTVEPRSEAGRLVKRCEIIENTHIHTSAQYTKAATTLKETVGKYDYVILFIRLLLKFHFNLLIVYVFIQS